MTKIRLKRSSEVCTCRPLHGLLKTVNSTESPSAWVVVVRSPKATGAPKTQILYVQSMQIFGTIVGLLYVGKVGGSMLLLASFWKMSCSQKFRSTGCD